MIDLGRGLVEVRSERVRPRMGDQLALISGKALHILAQGAAQFCQLLGAAAGHDYAGAGAEEAAGDLHPEVAGAAEDDTVLPVRSGRFSLDI